MMWVLLIISTVCWPAVEKIDDNYYRITSADAREFAKIAKENELLKAELRKPQRLHIYAGANTGTYGIGGNVGIIF
jgi:hypothetical protein